ncbi:MAG: cysteine desulfurase-like protein [Terriglobales bacterium]
MNTPQFPISWVRESFPALNIGDNFIFFDNGAGAQVPQTVLDAVQHHLISRNVQRGGRYRQSREVDEAIQSARESVAMFLNALDPAEVAFGMNATSFIRIVSQAIGENIRDRREIIVSDLDHEANVATWLDLQRKGCEILWWKMREDGTLHTSDLEPLLSSQTRLVACTMASNALGSIVDVKDVARMAHAVGAEVFLDAVHYAPHGALDVQALDCDYLVCSGYKIFAPHMGFVWGKREALETLPTFREDFIPNHVPMKIEVGTFVYENVAGMDAAIGYLEELGTRARPDAAPTSRRGRLLQGMEAIRTYEASLSLELIKELSSLEGIALYGVIDPLKINQRVPTVCFNLRGVAPCTVSEKCAAQGIGIRDGNMYSPRLLQRLLIPADTGAVRASLAHYNTVDEIQKFADVLREIDRS